MVSICYRRNSIYYDTKVKIVLGKEVLKMNSALDEVASTCSSDKSFKNLLCGNNYIIIIVIFAILLCGCQGNNFIGGINPCVKPARGCNTTTGGFQNNLWIWILVALLLFGGNALGGSRAGNINTNVINVDPEDNSCYDDSY